MEKCPTCERKFEKFSDYPSMYIEKVSKLDADLLEQIGCLDGLKEIMKILNPYVSDLEKLVGKDVVPQAITPEFLKESSSSNPEILKEPLKLGTKYNIPNSSWCFYLNEANENRKKIFDTPPNYQILDFVAYTSLTNPTKAGHNAVFEQVFVQIFYAGRLNKHE